MSGQPEGLSQHFSGRARPWRLSVPHFFVRTKKWGRRRHDPSVSLAADSSPCAGEPFEEKGAANLAAPFLVEPLLCRGFEEALEHGGHLGSRGLALGGEGALAGAAHDPRAAGPLHGGNRVLAQIREAGESGGRGDMAGACVDRTHLGPQRRGPTSGLKSVPATRPNPPPRQKKLTPFRFRPEAENSISVPSFFLIRRKPALLGFPAVLLLGGNPPVSPLRSETAPFAQGGL